MKVRKSNWIETLGGGGESLICGWNTSAQQRRQVKGKALPLEQPEEWRGGAVFWPPTRVQRARETLTQQDAQAAELQLQKACQKEIRIPDKQLEAGLL